MTLFSLQLSIIIRITQRRGRRVCSTVGLDSIVLCVKWGRVDKSLKFFISNFRGFLKILGSLPLSAYVDTAPEHQGGGLKVEINLSGP